MPSFKEFPFTMLEELRLDNKTKPKVIFLLKVHVCFFSSLYYLAVSFIGGGNWSTRIKPLTCCKSLTNLII